MTTHEMQEIPNDELKQFEQRAIMLYAENAGLEDGLSVQNYVAFFQIYRDVPDNADIVSNMHQVPMPRHKQLLLSMARAQVWCDEESVNGVTAKLKEIYEEGLLPSLSLASSYGAPDRQWTPWKLVNMATEANALPFAQTVLKEQEQHFSEQEYANALMKIGKQYTYTARDADGVHRALAICDELKERSALQRDTESQRPAYGSMTVELQGYCEGALVRLETQKQRANRSQQTAVKGERQPWIGDLMLSAYNDSGLEAALAIPSTRFDRFEKLGYLLTEVARVDQDDTRIKQLMETMQRALIAKGAPIEAHTLLRITEPLIDFYGRQGNLADGAKLVETLPQELDTESPHSIQASGHMSLTTAYLKANLPQHRQDRPFLGGVLANILQYEHTYLTDAQRENHRHEVLRQLGAHGCIEEIAYVGSLSGATLDLATTESTRIACLARNDIGAYLETVDTMQQTFRKLSALCSLLHELRLQMAGKQGDFPRYLTSNSQYV